MLTTYSEKTSPTTAVVHWRSSAIKCGIIDVTLPYESEDVDIVGELVALQYLIVDKEIFGQSALHGEGLEVEVSKGAIKKILTGKTTKKEIIKYASFIPFLLQGISLKTHKKCSKNDEYEECISEKILVDVEKYTNTRLLVSSPVIGDIEITSHSVSRYLERIRDESGNVKFPLKSLVARLTNPELRKVVLPENVVSHKLRKYGESDEFSVWKHPTSTLNFGLIKVGPVFNLVTVFINKQQ
jgi:hypothetical protein